MAVDYSTIQSLGLGESSTASTGTKKATQLGQSEFFKLMTAQLTNQNPLKPLDGTEFLSQVAQFNTVSGINDLNKAFDTFAATMSAGQNLQASALVGHDVYLKSDKVELTDSSPVEGRIVLPNAATDVSLSIISEGGEQIRTLNLGSHPAGETVFKWDGKDDEGAEMEPGTYRIKAEAVINRRNQSVDTLVRDHIGSVTLNGSKGMQVQLRDHGNYSVTDLDRVL